MGIINFSRGVTKPIFVCLPESIIAEIILGLPIRSILRCRRVCKAWLHLISSKYFNNLVLKKRSSMTFILRGLDDQCCLFELQNRTSLTKNPCYPIKAMKLNFKFGVPSSGLLQVIGSCNGLFSLFDCVNFSQFTVHIWNPVMGQYITFPIGKRVSLLFEPSVDYGFGYSHITDQYKVIRIVEMRRKLFDVQVLSLGTNTWRRVGNTHSRPDRMFGYCYLNGIVHWICVDDYPTADWGICSFNNCTEQLGFISPPPLDCTSYIDCTGYETRGSLNLKAVRECFCVVHGTREGFVLWSMKDYGVAESWSRHAFVEFPDSFRSKITSYVTALWGDDEEFLFCQYIGSLGYFDSKEKQYKKLKTTIDDGRHFRMDVYPYFPSFIPLFEVFKEEPSKMLISHKGCFRLLLSSLRSYFYR